MRSILLTSFAVLHLSCVGTVAKTPFSIQQQNEIDWLIKPSGERFFSFGVCVVNQGASRDDFNPTNPGYAAFRYYQS
jgi:hypothetical protein